MDMSYLAAEESLARAEAIAWDARDFDTLARLYLPLQEARRQRRQRAGEGTFQLDLLPERPNDDWPNADAIAQSISQGQLLIAGWGSIAPALRLRELARERQLYLDTFLAAVYPIDGGGRAVVIVPLEDVALPDPHPRLIDDLLPLLPPHSIALHENELPKGPRNGTWETYGQVMAIWERLHAPFLAAAEMQVDPVRRMEHYRKTIRVDYACELAHQRLAEVAHAIKS